MFENKKIYIAPYSPISMQLAKEFNNHTTLLGFVDKSADGKDIYRPSNIDNYDYILIYSPNHYKAIYKEYISFGIPKSKIVIVSKDNLGYHYNTNITLFEIKESIKEKKESLIERLCSIKSIKKENRVLLVSPDFIDLNTKYLFLYLIQKDIDVYLATDNKEHYNLYSTISNRVVLIPSTRYIYLAATSKIKVLERIITSKSIKKSLSNSYILQIWHGIALKRLNNMNGGLTLDAVVSTSKWATENNFCHFFDTKEFIQSGYPRCDVFKRELEENDYIMTDSETIKYIKDNSDKKVVIYMPTYRENSFKSSPLDFEKLNSFCKEQSIIFIVKMHPFELLGLFDTISEIKLSNIIFYKAGCDIYPLLKSSDMLITDYSSIYFDYLLADKPIVYFVYDMAEYIASRGEFMLDFDEFTAGDRADTLEKLFEMITKNLSTDSYKSKRERLKNIFFDNNSLASQSIYNHLLKLKA